jgi:hypothetical protein
LTSTPASVTYTRTGKEGWMRRIVALPICLFVLLGGHPAVASGGSGGSRASLAGDFDGDGFEDLVIAVEEESVRGDEAAGAVHVLYGSRAGPTARRDDLWHQDRRGIPGGAEEFDRFGSAVAAGDFDGDGRDDLAIGVRSEDMRGVSGAGVVHILYGTQTGLGRGGNQVWHRAKRGVNGGLGSDGFGSALAAGDLDGDGRDDLAIGAPSGEVAAVDGAGYVHVLYGTRSGLSARGDDVFHQDTPGIADDPGPAFEAFGSALAIADFGWSGADDLAIGVPDEDVDGSPNSGAAHVLRGTGRGATATGSQFWHQNVPDVEGQIDSPTEFFGSSLAAANFGRGRRADLAVGVPGDAVSGVSNAGAVNVLYGGPGGLTVDGDQLWHQAVSEVEGDLEIDDLLGFALAGADLGRSRHADLAAGAINANTGGMHSAGEVNVLYGSAGGLMAASDQLWTQDSPGILDAADDPSGTGGFGDEFGWDLSAGRYDGRGRADLAASAASEDVAGFVDAGAVNVIFSRAGGLTARRDQFWHQARRGIPDGPEEDEKLGQSLA